MKISNLFFIFYIFLTFQTIFAAQAEDLPGNEISDEDYFRFKNRPENIKTVNPIDSVMSETWINKVEKTWSSPPLSQQLSHDIEPVKIGMGALFIPSYSNPDLEPEVDIIDTLGEVVANGKTGTKYSLVPGTYYVLLGSGQHRQRIVRKSSVVEGEITLVPPVWSGLSIEVVDENNQPLRSEYEIARIDTSEPFGRGIGRNPSIGEEVKTWVLKPGIYKLFGVGSGYNTTVNFVTVRLLPGEFTPYVLVKDSKTDKIIGGGTIAILANSEISSHWHYGLDIGGGIDFNYLSDYENDTVTQNSVDISALLEFRLKYSKNIVEWDSRLKFDEGASINKFNFSTITSSIDAARLTSLFTLKLLKKLGPYARVEFNTEIIPDRVFKPELPEDSKHYFLKLSKDKFLADIDSVSNKIITKQSFTPFSFDGGLGVNINLLSTRFFETKILGGLGYSYENHIKEWSLGSKSDILDTINGESNPDFEQCSTIVANESYTVLLNNTQNRYDLGPEVLWYSLLRIGHIATLESELRYFPPFGRMDRPDISARSVLSWNLTRMMTLNYEFKYNLVQSNADLLRQNYSTHRILFRFTFNSR